MQFSEEVKATLWNLIDVMSSALSDFTVNPQKDFTRKKKWDFPTLIKFIISMESQSLKNELHKYFGYTTDCPTNASFNQRRSQIKSDAFKYLFESFTNQYNNKPSLFNGYRLIACDGSDINISHDPNDEETYFSHGDAKGFNQLHLNAMYDLINRIYTDIIIQPARKENEHKAFCDMVDRYTGTEKTIFIVDRGYEAYNNLAHVIEKGEFFLFRSKDINSSGILSGSKDKLPTTEKFDTTLSLILTRKWTNEVLNHPEVYRRFRNKDSFEFLDLDEHAYYYMNLRVLRFPISETEYECVITNLPAEDFTADEIKKLYAMRWGIETSFRELKYAVGLTSFHAKKREYIIQEIWARLILYNFCEIITAHVTIEKCTKKHTYQINYTFAIHICRYFISKMAEKSPPDVEALISKEILPVRPGRHDPRKVDHKKAVSFLYRVA
ncbi:IS4 family transposase [Anaerosporobacter sp.]